MNNKKIPYVQARGTGRPQASRLQPVVRKAGLRKIEKPKGGK